MIFMTISTDIIVCLFITLLSYYLHNLFILQVYHPRNLVSYYNRCPSSWNRHDALRPRITEGGGSYFSPRMCDKKQNLKEKMETSSPF